jgi:signal transduction histidine kinase
MENTTAHTLENILINRRELTPREWVQDVALGLGVFILGCVYLIWGGGSLIPLDDAFREFTGVQRYVFSYAPFFYMAVMSLVLVVRRITPWFVFVVVLGTYLAGRVAMGGQELLVLAPCVALFTIAEERSRWEVVTASAIALLAVAFMATPGTSLAFDLYTRLMVFMYFALAVFMGISVRSYRRYRNEAEQRIEEAAAIREKDAEKAVEAERVRIARELHDITAHSLSAIGIQAAAAERIVDLDPQLAKEAIQNIRSTAKDSLAEIRAMIGVLRGEGEAAENRPTHGTEHIGELVQYLESACISVTCNQSHYRREAVPLYIDVAVFGIAREAVTNIVKHAHAKHVDITLHATEDLVTLMVVDDGQGMGGSYAHNASFYDDPALHVGGGGHGLQGMAERTNLLGGGFGAYDVKGGGFAVVVRLPFHEKEHAGEAAEAQSAPVVQREQEPAIAVSQQTPPDLSAQATQDMPVVRESQPKHAAPEYDGYDNETTPADESAGDGEDR